VSIQRHELHLLTGSYALDALTGAEETEFEKHLARCPACTEEVRGLRETAARLAMATAVTPPPRLRDQVLAAAPRIRQLPPPARSAPARSALARAGQRTVRRRLPLSRAAITTGMLALAAAVAFLLITQATTRNQLQQAQASNRALTAVLSAPDARIESAPASVGGTVTAVMSLRQHEAVVTAAGMTALSGSKVYQLWVITSSGAARSAGLLPASRSGSTAPVLAAGILPGDRLGITVEPAGGTARPTTVPVVLMPVTA
jgi:anti-sigma-K factor RskA